MSKKMNTFERQWSRTQTPPNLDSRGGALLSFRDSTYREFF